MMEHDGTTQKCVSYHLLPERGSAFTTYSPLIHHAHGHPRFQVKEAVALAGDGRHCVEFWLDGHNPERTESRC